MFGYLRRRRRYRTALRLQVAGRGREAVEAYRLMLDGSGRDANVHRWLIECYTETGQDKRAAECAVAGLALRPTDFDFLVLVGQHRQRIGDTASAREHAARAARYRPAELGGLPKPVVHVLKHAGRRVGIDAVSEADRTMRRIDQVTRERIRWVEAVLSDRAEPFPPD